MSWSPKPRPTSGAGVSGASGEWEGCYVTGWGWGVEGSMEERLREGGKEGQKTCSETPEEGKRRQMHAERLPHWGRLRRHWDREERSPLA